MTIFPGAVTMGKAFEQCRCVEQRAMNDLESFFRQMSWDGRFVITDKGRLSYKLQKTVGDVLINSQRTAETVGVEVKAEEENKHGNFFFETWSNRSRWKPGWMSGLDADVLCYYFIKEQELYLINLEKLRIWAFTLPERQRTQNIYHFPEKPQSKYQQLNDTWGRCVPISVVGEYVGFRKYTYCPFSETWVIAEREK